MKLYHIPKAFHIKIIQSEVDRFDVNGKRRDRKSGFGKRKEKLEYFKK